MRTKVKKLTVWSVLLVFAILIIWILTRPQVLELGVKTIQKPDFIFENPVITETRKGDKHYKITATRGELYKLTGQAFIYDVSANIYTQSEIPVHLTAPRAKVNIDTVTVTFTNPDVKYVYDEPVLMTADTLTWQSQDNLLSGKGNVKLVQNDVTVRAEKVTGLLNKGVIHLENRPRVIIN